MQKGTTHTEESKMKNRLAHIGKTAWNKGLPGLSGSSNYFYGKKHTAETRKRMSDLKRGPLHNFFGTHKSDETKRKIGLANSISLKGHVIPLEVRKKMGDSHRGEKSHFWRGGVTSIQDYCRTIMEYDIWRKSVFARDNYICQECGARNGVGKAVVLNADHIKQFAAILLENKVTTTEDARKCDALWDINNGRTLCEPCHRETPTYARRLNLVNLQAV